MAKEKFYITTPIYYVNDDFHIGQAYTTVAADVMARFKRFCGYDVHFLTGTDEHGAKIARSARERGMHPKALADEVVVNSQNLWRRLNISHNDFIRTTEQRHEDTAQKFIQKVHDNGFIYLGEYEGWYCTPDETFWTETQLDDDKCPDCGRPVERVKEESYFFQMSQFQKRLLDHIEANPRFIQPTGRRNEIVSRVRAGLEDLSITRTTVEWGIPLPMDEKHTIYVWVEALVNYLTAIGYGTDGSTLDRYWPADLHLIGKDILWFHTVIWPTLLMAAELPLPHRVFAHGWWTVEGEKMSKSKGNVVDPNTVIDVYGTDAFRYFLLREGTFGNDVDYSQEAMLRRFNNELANDLGNLLSRSVAMVERYCQGTLPQPDEQEGIDASVRDLALATVPEVEKAVDDLQFNIALERLWNLVRRVNKYIEEVQPWTLGKQKKVQRLHTVLYHIAESLRFITLLIGPFMPETAEKMWQQLGLEGTPADHTIGSLAEWGAFKPGTKMTKGPGLFPKTQD